MIRTELIIGVNDVLKSSKWYQDLLGCTSTHGGHTFEILADHDGTVILCLHKWGDHEHPTLRTSETSAGNGLIIYFRVGNLDEIWDRAQQLHAVIEAEPNLNPNSGKTEFSIRDLDNYYLIISE